MDPKRLTDDYDEVAEYTKTIRSSESKVCIDLNAFINPDSFQDNESQGSGETSGADEQSDKEEVAQSSADESDEEANKRESFLLNYTLSTRKYSKRMFSKITKSGDISKKLCNISQQHT